MTSLVAVALGLDYGTFAAFLLCHSAAVFILVIDKHQTIKEQWLITPAIAVITVTTFLAGSFVFAEALLQIPSDGLEQHQQSYEVDIEAEIVPLLEISHQPREFGGLECQDLGVRHQLAVVRS